MIEIKDAVFRKNGRFHRCTSALPTDIQRIVMASDRNVVRVKVWVTDVFEREELTINSVKVGTFGSTVGLHTFRISPKEAKKILRLKKSKHYGVQEDEVEQSEAETIEPEETDEMAEVMKLVNDTAVPVPASQVIDACQDQICERVVLWDSQIWAMPLATWRKVIAVTDTDKISYISEKYDCDNFALGFKADVDRLGSNGVGLVVDFGRRHAYNVVVIKEENSNEIQLRLIEPQNDRWILTDDDPNTKHINSGYLIFC